MDELKQLLSEHISVFVGQSGVGKSSLIKNLLPDQNIAIGELSEAAQKGKHTTTHTALFHFPFGGNCIDSPGIREFGLWHLNEEQVTRGFIDIREFATRCKFRNCNHNKEPQCGVKEALITGELSQERFDNYLLILQTLDEIDVREP